MNYNISQVPLNQEIKRQIYDGFKKAAIDATGIDGLANEPISFQIIENEVFVGAVVVQMFWGQLHIKYLYVDVSYRNKGIGRMLMEHALNFGWNQGCNFAFVETMSFQAPKFYQKLGF